MGSTVGLAQVFLYLAEIWTEKRRKFLVKWVVNRRLTRLDLEAADLDHDRAVRYVKRSRFYKKKVRFICDFCNSLYEI